MAAPGDWAAPESETHKVVLDHCLQRIKLSSDAMRRFYDRWRSNERRLQAYLTLRDYEQLNTQMKNGKGASPKPIDIVVPYSYSAVHSMCTYLFHVFGGQKPIFPVMSYSGAQVSPGKFMETKLEFDCAETRILKHIWQVLFDSLTYGCGIFKVNWESRQANRTREVERSANLEGLLAQALQAGPPITKQRSRVTVYEGNRVESIDPFRFFPDPRVSMGELAENGEFVFWRTFESKMSLLKQQAAGVYAFVENVGTLAGRESDETSGESNRDLLSRGDSSPGRSDRGTEGAKTDRYVQIDQGTIDLIPAKLGISEETTPQRWLITIANSRQIIGAEVFDPDHELHPVAVVELDSMGYGFGQPATMDFIGPLQDTMSWFLNAHVKNVNAAINNSLVVDPAMIEMQDLKFGGEGRIIRLKRAAFGQDVRQAVQQLQVTDVTRGHVDDMRMMMMLADAMLGVNENLRGIQQAGGRKTATEIRTASDAGSSRLAARARMASAQGVSDVSKMMAYNNLQYLSMDFGVQVLGQDFLTEGFLVPNGAGQYWSPSFPIQDGTLPPDKIALMDVWTQLMAAVLADPQLRTGFDIMKLFIYVAKLGGAQNVETFQVQAPGVMPMPDQAVLEQAAAGNMVPASALGGINGLEGDPSQRLLLS